MRDLATFSIYAEDIHSLPKLLALHDNVLKDLKTAVKKCTCLTLP